MRVKPTACGRNGNGLRRRSGGPYFQQHSLGGWTRGTDNFQKHSLGGCIIDSAIVSGRIGREHTVSPPTGR